MHKINKKTDMSSELRHNLMFVLVLQPFLAKPNRQFVIFNMNAMPVFRSY